ncbi:hypothetical protein VPH35_036810 [Triticum aestivum]
MADADSNSNPLLADFDFPPFDRVEPAHVCRGIRALLARLVLGFCYSSARKATQVRGGGEEQDGVAGRRGRQRPQLPRARVGCDLRCGDGRHRGPCGARHRPCQAGRVLLLHPRRPRHVPSATPCLVILGYLNRPEA